MRRCTWALLLPILVGACGGSTETSGGNEETRAGADNAGDAGEAGEAGTAGRDQGSGGSDLGLSGSDSGGESSQGGSGNAPTQGGSGNAPTQGGSGNAPAQGGSGNVPTQGGSGNAPAQGGSGNVPAQGGASAGVAGAAFCTVQTSAASANANVIDATAGHFEDHCDANGDLVQYQCELTYIYDPNCLYPLSAAVDTTLDGVGPSPAVAVPICTTVPVPTGNVIETDSACAGRCQDATCPNECPDYDEKVTYLSIDRNTGAAQFSFPRFDKTLDCELIFDRDTDDYDCVLDPQPDREVDIPSLGLSSSYCLEGNIGNIGMDDPTHDGIEECAYRCDVVAP